MIPLNVLSKVLFTTIILVIVSAVYSAVQGIRLSNYLKKNYYKLWRKLTSIGTLGPGFGNTIAGIQYEYSDDKTNDEQLIKD